MLIGKTSLSLRYLAKGYRRGTTIIITALMVSAWLCVIACLNKIASKLNNFDPGSNRCICKRNQVFPLDNKTRLNSTCSDERSFYKKNQNVISYSYHVPPQSDQENGSGNISRFHTYRRGVLENIRAMRAVYPGYIMRIYTDASLDEFFCDILCNNEDVQWCDIRKTPSHGDMSVLDLMVWRFLALGDPTVKIMLSRDLDSILTNRESRAVLDWQVNTTKMLISLRDHPSHEVPLLGGMWGANNHLVGHTLGTQLQAAIIWNGVDRQNDFASGYDQFVLTQAIWRPYKEHFVSYDSYSCYIYMWDDNFLLVRPFPTQRENNQNDFVGNPELGGGNYNLQPCPVECRPSYGKNWTYC